MSVVAAFLAAVVACLLSVTRGAPARATTARPCVQRVHDWRYAWADPTLQRVTVTAGSCRRDAPWMILIHGGSWIHGDRTSMDPATRIFYRHGWQIFNIDYRRGLGITWPQQERDLLAAYRWVTRHAVRYHLDLARGSVYGFSAGGQMAAWLGNAEPSLTAVVTVSGVLQPQRVAADADTTQMGHLSAREAYMMGCGWPAASSACAARWANFAPQDTITTASPPVFMLQGDDDLLVPSSTPDAYAWHLMQAGVHHVVIHVPGLGHTQHLLEDSQWRQWRIVHWLRKQEP